MAKLHHSTLKAAVLRYSALLPSSEDELRKAILEDEKGFDEDQANEIFEAIAAGAKTNDNDYFDDPIVEIKGTVGNLNHNEWAQPPVIPPASTGKGKRTIVVQSFRDIANYDKEWKVGSDVSHFDKKRIAHLLDIGYAVQK